MTPVDGTMIHGRTTITAKALNRVVTAVAATALEVDAKRVGADVADERGLIALSIRAPIRVPSLQQTPATTGTGTGTGSAIGSGISSGISSPTGVGSTGAGTILDRAERARGEISSRVEEITGSSIARVVVRLESATIARESRVR